MKCQRKCLGVFSFLLLVKSFETTCGQTFVICRFSFSTCHTVSLSMAILSAISRILSQRSSRTIFSLSRLLLVVFDTVGRRERSSSRTSVRPIGVARGVRGPGPPPIKIPLTTKKLWQHSLAMFSCSFFSVITHITVINNNINDNKWVLGPPSNNQGALTNNQGALTNNQGALESLTDNQGVRDP